MRSKVPWPPRSGRIRLWVSRSPSSVIFTPRRPNGSSRSTISGVSSSPLVMMLMPRSMPRARRRAVQPLGQVVHDRQIEQRLAAEEHQGERAPGATRSISRSTQAAVRTRRVERHLLGELVVVAVVALEAVVAREVALQRRQHRDVQLRRIAGDRSRSSDRGPDGRESRSATRNPLSRSRSAVSRSSPASASNDARPSMRSSSAATSGETTNCASVNVFIRNTSFARKRDTDIENRRLHPSRGPRPVWSCVGRTVRTDACCERDRTLATVRAATRVPLHARRVKLSRLLKEKRCRVDRGSPERRVRTRRAGNQLSRGREAIAGGVANTAGNTADCGQQSTAWPVGQVSGSIVTRRADAGLAAGLRACPSYISTYSKVFQGTPPCQ